MVYQFYLIDSSLFWKVLQELLSPQHRDNVCQRTSIYVSMHSVHILSIFSLCTLLFLQYSFYACFIHYSFYLKATLHHTVVSIHPILNVLSVFKTNLLKGLY